MGYTRNKRNKRNKTIRRIKKINKQTNKQTNEIMMCSPAVKKSRVHSNSCFTPEIVMNIRDAYNKNNPSPIKDTNPSRVWWLLKERLSCPKEECLLDQLGDSAMKARIRRFIFAPIKPPEWKSNPDEWLSNYDIEDVIKQYEVSHPEFKMIGPTTIDFDTRLPEEGGKCVLEDLCKFDLARFIRAKRTKIGVVFNLDKHDQSGSHWVSLFIDIDNKFIFFFDSADNAIPSEIFSDNNKKQQPLVNRIIEQGKEQGIDFTFYNNRGNQHQQSNTECGMYSLFFIITMLTRETPFTKGVLSVDECRDLFLEKRIPDKTVFGYRRLYFNN